MESPAKSQLQKVQRQQVKPFMTLDYQIVNQTLKRSHPPPPGSALLVQHGEPSAESDTGLTGNPLTSLSSWDIREHFINSKKTSDIIATTDDMRWNKGTILKASVEYIKWLQKEQQRARELEHRQKKLEQANRRLLLRIQELEIQARAHGLPALASLGTVDLGVHVTKQQTHLEQNSVDYCQQLTLSQGTSPELCDQAMAFSDPLSHFTDLSFSAALKEEQRLNDMLLDDTISPFGTDPLLSATSPAVSKESSRRSSFSSDD
ncbi:hypothetical protein GH733_013434, partial [Mirounga leonina]